MATRQNTVVSNNMYSCLKSNEESEENAMHFSRGILTKQNKLKSVIFAVTYISLPSFPFPSYPDIWGIWPNSWERCPPQSQWSTWSHLEGNTQNLVDWHQYIKMCFFHQN